MTTKPLFSIVIANYNYGRFLEDAIRSVIDQEMGDDVELIICDGGSTDNSVDVIKKYAGGLPPVVERSDPSILHLHLTPTPITWWCSEKDGGQSAAFNKGFSHARGRFLTWLNADDLLLPGALKAVANAIHHHPETKWFVGSTLWMDVNGFVKQMFVAHRFSKRRLASRTLSACGPSSFFSRDLYDAVGGIDESFHFKMDTLLWHEFALKLNQQYVCVKDYVWAYRMHEASKMAGRVTDPGSPNVMLRNRAIADESRRLADRVGRSSRLASCVGRLPTSPIDCIRAAFLQWRYRGRHVNFVFKSLVLKPKLLLSYAMNEYIKGLIRLGGEVHAPDNWGRGVVERCSGLTIVPPEIDKDYRALARYVADNGISVLYAQGVHDLVRYWKARKFVPTKIRPVLLVTCHSPFVLMRFAKAFLYISLACCLSDGIVFLAERYKIQWRWMTRLLLKKTYHVPNPTDIDRVVPGKKSPVAGREVVIGSVATIDPRKRQDIIVDVVRGLRGRGYTVRGMIAGDVKFPDYKLGMERKLIEDRMDDKIEWLGRVERSQVPALMQRFDLYLCPSDLEVMPYSILEAMCAGIPVIAHDIAGIGEEVEDGVTGRLITGQNVSAYVEAIAAIIDRNSFEELGKAGRVRAVLHFSMGRFAARMQKVVCLG